jgi:hypothetical protein
MLCVNYHLTDKVNYNKDVFMNKLKLAFGLIFFALLIVLYWMDIQSWIVSFSLQLNEPIKSANNTATNIEPTAIFMLGILCVCLGLYLRSNRKKK